MHFADGAADHFVARDLFVGAEDVFGGVVGVDVGGDEVDGDVVLFAVLEEGRDPGGLCGGGATDEEAATNFFDGESGVVVELEVSWLLRAADPEVEVGFVPYFEAPFGYFFNSVAIDEVLGKAGDHSVP